MKKITTILLAAVALTACEIDRLPYGSMAAEQITKDPNTSLESLVTGSYSQLKAWSDPMHRLGEYAGDNVAKDKSSSDAFFDFISYARKANNYRLDQFWNNGYKAIAQASNVINMIDEGQNTAIDYQIGECYFIRGMQYFYLGRAFGRPYSQNPEKSLGGVPIVNGTPEDINNMNFPDRNTVKETYEQAINDLKKAAQLMESRDTKREGPGYASMEAAWAMLSRIYLYMSGTYETPNQEYAQLAVEYSTKVIESKGKDGGLAYQLLAREDFMRYNTFKPENNEESIFVVKIVASEKPDYWNSIGGLYSYAGQQGWAEMYASAKYIALLDENGRNDWRPNKKNIVDARANFISPNYIEKDGKYTDVFRFIKNIYDKDGKHTGFVFAQLPYTQSGSTVTCKEGDQSYTLTLVDAASEKYTITYADGNTYEGVLDYLIGNNNGLPNFYILKCSSEGTASGETDSQLHSPVISRLGEIYMNRAEAYAKLGNYSAALTDLNIIRERSLGAGKGYESLDATTAKERIEKERHLELAFQAERSYDVFRNGGTLTRRYPGVHDAMLEVGPTDYRILYFIPQNAINAYPGTLTQNPASN